MKIVKYTMNSDSDERPVITKVKLREMLFPDYGRLYGRKSARMTDRDLVDHLSRERDSFSRIFDNMIIAMAFGNKKQLSRDARHLQYVIKKYSQKFMKDKDFAIQLKQIAEGEDIV